MTITADLISKLKLDSPGCSLCLLKIKDKNGSARINDEVQERITNILAVSLQNGIIDFIDVSSSKIISQYPLECQSEAWAMRSMGVNNTQSLLIIGSALGIIYCLSIELLTKVNGENELIITKKWSQKTGDMVTKIELCDINDDKITELIASSIDKTVRVLDPINGNYIWGQVFQAGITTFMITDVNDDHKLELVGGAANGSLRVFNGSNGNLLCYTQLPNNIRTLNLIKKPQSVDATSIDASSPYLILCGCDDMKIYLVDGKNCKKLQEIQETAYVWLSAAVPTTPPKILVTTYSFDYMEGMVESDQKMAPSIKLYENDYFKEVYAQENANVQCMSEIHSREGSFIIALGTTEKTVNILNLSSNNMDLMVQNEDIINGILLENKDNQYILCYCDDASQLNIWRFT